MPEDPPLAQPSVQDYLDYRRLKAGTGRLSLDMIKRINELDSHLGVRGRIAPEALAKPSPQRAIKNAQTAQLSENREKASNALRAFLEGQGKRGNGGELKSDAIKAYLKGTVRRGSAEELKFELEMFGEYCASQARLFELVRWIPGPLKKLEKAMPKTEEDYKFEWGNNKDLVRGTLACETQLGLKLVTDLMKKIVTPEFGMSFIKKMEVIPSSDPGGNSTTGYSGWNFVIRFKDHPMFGAEVQANTYDMMYGKMAADEFCKQLLVSDSQYSEFQSRLMFPGGLGHALYDISEYVKAGTTKEESVLALKLANDYNDACRGSFRNTNLGKLNQDIMDFLGKLTSGKAKELWKHSLRECRYPALVRMGGFAPVKVTGARLTGG
jgi:hypothetical protein